MEAVCAAQGQLLPAFADEALDASDPVFFIDDVVDGLELGALEQRYAVMGEHAYAPRLLLKLWLYGATQGVYSGRELARRVRLSDDESLSGAPSGGLCGRAASDRAPGAGGGACPAGAGGD